jgi:hypothetical protein
MKVVEYTQQQAMGFFDANANPVVIEFMLGNEVLVVTGERGKPVSNGQAKKYLGFLEKDQTFTNRSVTDLGYQAFLLENGRRKNGQKVRALGFIGKNIPEGRSAEVTLRVTICNTNDQAVTVSKLYRDTRLPKVRTARRAVPIAKNTVTELSMYRPTDNLVIDAGTAQNISVKFA